MDSLTRYSDGTVELMGEMIAMYLRLGEIRAKINWVSCGDPDGRANRYRILNGYAQSMGNRIKKFWVNLETILDDWELDCLKNECMKECDERMNECEINVEKEYRPMDLNLNSKAIVVMTRKEVPDDIKIGLSFGWKFLFPFVSTSKNIHSVLAQLDHCIEQSVPECRQNEAFKHVANILARRPGTRHSDTIQWLCFIAQRSKRFFGSNKDVFATRSDKGGHTVIIDLAEYESVLSTLLNVPSYGVLEKSPLRSLVKTECKLIKFCNTNHKIQSIEKTRSYRLRFEPHTLCLAKFYGLPKVHKENFCLRPIMALNGAPGYASGKIFDIMLNWIFPRTHFHIKDSYDMKDFLDTVIIREEDVLVSFDVVSMFTSIPRNLVKEIVLAKSDEFFANFGMSRNVLVRFLEFLLEESPVFTALDGIFEQKEGLPMGSCISPTLARIVMDRIIKHLLDKVPEISFIRVFVDDTITAVNNECVEKALDALNDFNPGIKFTCEVENEYKMINFLNLTLIRDGNFISTNWFRKVFASGRLLNFLSSHKRTTIVETARNFIRTVIALSDGSFFESNKKVVIETLRDNNFPETLIISLMNECYTLMKLRSPSSDEEKNYVIYPHAICESRKIKRVLHEMKHDDVTFAESTKNTKINFVTTRKTITPLIKKSNMVISSKCQCGRKYRFTSTCFNENVEMAIKKRVSTLHRRCRENIHAFREFYVHKGLAYESQTKVLARYIQWKYRGSYLNMNTGMPQYHFMKLLGKGRQKGVRINLK